jgi:hypothetical protein
MPPGTVEEQLEFQYSHYFEQNGATNDNNQLYSILLNNNLPTQDGIFLSGKPQCEFCGSTHKDNCPLNIPDKLTVREIESKIQHERDMEVII